jgi:hypothetical protein
MLIRFRPDVIALAPRVVVILAGTNDISGNTGPMTLGEIEANLQTMCELARLHSIRVVLASVLPVHNYTERSKLFFPLRPPDQILELNRWIKDYANRNNYIHLDYFSAMVDDKGLLQRDLSEDGLHPNGPALRTARSQSHTESCPVSVVLPSRRPSRSREWRTHHTESGSAESATLRRRYDNSPAFPAPSTYSPAPEIPPHPPPHRHTAPLNCLFALQPREHAIAVLIETYCHHLFAEPEHGAQLP